jgi:probable HAF family extracellular repeat protein
MTSCKTVLAVAVLLLALGSLAVAQGTYTGIVAPNARDTIVEGINTAGEMVGSYYNEDIGVWQGFLLSGTNFTTLDYPGALYGTYASGINDEGQVVGYAETQDAVLGYVYDTQTQTFTAFPTYPGAIETAGTDINNFGTIVGYATIEHGSYVSYEGFELVGATYTKIPVISMGAGTGDILTAINNSGEIVGATLDSTRDVTGSFIYSQGTFQPFRVTGRQSVIATGINDAGTIVGYFDSYLGFVFQDNTFTPLRYPGTDILTEALAINSAGQVVGFFLLRKGKIYEAGFTWTPPADPEKK